MKDTYFPLILLSIFHMSLYLILSRIRVCVTKKTGFEFDDRIHATGHNHKSLSDTVIFFLLDTPREVFWLPTEMNTTTRLYPVVLLQFSFRYESKSKSHCDWPDIYYCLTVTVLFLWGALSDERAGLTFVYAADSSQRSLSRVRVPWDSRPYFTVSDVRLYFSSPPTTCRVTVEVFDHACTQVFWFYSVLYY
jgi:hypothetical protein